MNLAQCLPYLLHEFKTETDLTQAIEELSENFTTKRESLSDYLKDPRLVSAYTAFYLTTNYPKFEAVLKWLPEDFLREIRKAPFVDIGAGPGTFSLAFAQWRGGNGNSIYQIETSEVMRNQAQKIWKGLHGELALSQFSRVEKIEGSFALFGHSANEMGADHTIEVIKKLRPDHILFIEPGTKIFFKEMMKIRMALISEGFNLLYPCPHSNACPLAESQEDWCHQYVHVQQAADVERLTQLVRKDRRMLPLTVQAFSKSVGHQDKERIVRVHPSTKFSFEWDVCHTQKVDRYQVFRRDLNKDSQKILEGALSGDSLESEPVKDLSDGKRVKIKKINNHLV